MLNLILFDKIVSLFSKFSLLSSTFTEYLLNLLLYLISPKLITDLLLGLILLVRFVSIVLSSKLVFSLYKSSILFYNSLSFSFFSLCSFGLFIFLSKKLSSSFLLNFLCFLVFFMLLATQGFILVVLLSFLFSNNFISLFNSKSDLSSIFFNLGVYYSSSDCLRTSSIFVIFKLSPYDLFLFFMNIFSSSSFFIL